MPVSVALISAAYCNPLCDYDRMCNISDVPTSSLARHIGCFQPGQSRSRLGTGSRWGTGCRGARGHWEEADAKGP